MGKHDFLGHPESPLRSCDFEYCELGVEGGC